MARNDLYCSILANMGPDVFALAILITICVVISATSNRIIDYRIRKSSSAGETNNPNLPAHQDQQEVNKWSGELDTSPSTLEKPRLPQSKDPLAHRGWTCLGRGYIPPDVQLTMTDRFLVGLRETYGVTFFIVKLEATQLDMITLMVLNFWNVIEGISEVYGAILAFGFAVYYIVQGYFTYTFAQQIGQHVQKLKKSKEQDIVSQNQKSNIGVTILKETQQGFSKETDGSNPKRDDKNIELRDLFPTSPNSHLLFYTVIGLRTPKGMHELLGPVMNLARSFLLAFAIVVLSSAPLIQIITAA